MPAVRLFGRGWRVGSDDFVFPALFDLFVSIVWLVASVIIYLRNDSSLDCDGNGSVRMYIYGVFILLHFMIITSISLAHFSKTGSVMDTEARRFVPHILYFRVALHAVAVGWNTLGTVWAFDGTLQCPNAPETVHLVMGYVICNWILELFALVVVYIIFDPFGGKKAALESKNAVEFYAKCQDGLNAEQVPMTKNTKTWTRRFRKWCLISCLRPKTTKNALHEAGLIFGTIFTSANLVPTDVVAGLILLGLRNKDANREETVRFKSRDDHQEKCCAAVTQEPQIKPPLDGLMNEDWRNPKLLVHFLKFAMATYSWPLAIFDKRETVRTIVKKSTFCGCLPGRRHPLEPVDDNCCFCNTSAVKRYADVDDEQFVHLCFSNQVYGTPFFVVKDTLTKSIVVAIRGTLSFADVITDMAGWPATIDSEGLSPEFKAHHGMILSAKHVVKKLEELKILPQLLDENPGYHLVVTGTSLGAGTSTIMSMILRAKYPNVKCYAYAPPGGLLSIDAAEFCNDFVVSVVYGNDIVPRLGIRTMEKLKYAVMDALQESDSPKYQIILGALCMKKARRKLQRRRTAGGAESEADNRKTSKEELIDPESGMISVDLTNDHEEMKSKNNNCDSNGTLGAEKGAETPDSKTWVPCGDMWQPGEVIYITETPEFKLGHNCSNYIGGSRWRMRRADRTEFNEIIVHDRMIMDHMPYRMFKALKVLAQNGDPIHPLPPRR